MPAELSTIDLKILELVQRRADLSTGEIAEAVGLSQSPCWRRIQRLKDEGYISKQVALVDREKLGESFFIYASLKMSRLTDKERAEFIRKVENIPEIMECYTLFGEMDIMIKVYATSMNWYQSFIFNVLMKLPGVEDIRSSVTIAELKYTTALPVR
ncbi:Lrp/AsnC family transcriptional regulator [Amphiplicatus metriothermophilus]|uniref:Transcriptional regulator, AsnC family n=1 Tax=Amphiplicatus metriothermophilus TaxID=1519374 RepID=A0A239PV38_9PROT|nr:Lrp/AsnC family transcriptional regulator [Amphiplicatus metriothermophilus]MBB5519561.1 Lrp/AsnC family transcriptional regulator [Amphiplicatus metriothermophilus]SNT74125.1 transcriptional regulator, AsnC family [Amphiplicatus metriothermophilus]